MRVLFTYFILFSVQSIFGQAHIGDSFEALQSRYPEKRLKVYYANDGTKYTEIIHELGTFFYYFGGIYSSIDVCYQVPHDLKSLNIQIQVYNNKYVEVDDKFWKAYLDGGAIMGIELFYHEELQSYVFKYRMIST